MDQAQKPDAQSAYTDTALLKRVLLLLASAYLLFLGIYMLTSPERPTFLLSKGAGYVLGAALCGALALAAFIYECVVHSKRKRGALPATGRLRGRRIFTAALILCVLGWLSEIALTSSIDLTRTELARYDKPIPLPLAETLDADWGLIEGGKAENFIMEGYSDVAAQILLLRQNLAPPSDSAGAEVKNLYYHASYYKMRSPALADYFFGEWRYKPEGAVPRDYPGAEGAVYYYDRSGSSQRLLVLKGDTLIEVLYNGGSSLPQDLRLAESLPSP